MSTHRGRTTLVPAALALALALAGLAAAAAPVSVRAGKSEALGGSSILVDRAGRTLYHYTDDRGAKIACAGTCAKAWPPLLVSATGKPMAGAGVVASKLGTIKRPDGKLQVTYGGLTLYRFAGDTSAGQVKGQASGQEWYVVGPAGKLVKTKPVSSTGGNGGDGTSGGGATTPGDGGYDPTY